MGERPAAHAAAMPESTPADPAVHAVGVGPGNPAYLTDCARSVLRTADVLVGFESVLDVVQTETNARLLVCEYDDQLETLAEFAELVRSGKSGAAVLMGDPNISGYQFLGRVEQAVDGEVRVLPGISSVQIAASLARTPLEQSTIVSLHRRGSLSGAFERLETAADREHLIVLPRPYDWMPADIAERLATMGVAADRTALVFERLTLPDESVTRTTVGALVDTDSSGFSDLSIFVIRSKESIPVTERDTEGSP